MFSTRIAAHEQVLGKASILHLAAHIDYTNPGTILTQCKELFIGEIRPDHSQKGRRSISPPLARKQAWNLAYDPNLHLSLFPKGFGGMTSSTI